METIYNYFDHMFLVLPATPEVEKAKEELLGMAEDRYLDLKEQGKSENEAVGTVIEEFGNIDELAKELDLKLSVSPNPATRFLRRQEAENFLETYDKADLCLGLGVFFLILSPTLLMFLSCLNTGLRPIVTPGVMICLGIPYLFVFLAIGLCLIIYSQFSRKPFRSLAKERFQMDFSTAAYVEEEYKNQQKNFIFRIMLALSFLIIGVLPVIFMGVFYQTVPLVIRGIAVDALMIMYSYSIYSFIRAGMSQKRFKIIRQTNRFSRKKEKKNKRNGQY